jgi:hypothetical protein
LFEVKDAKIKDILIMGGKKEGCQIIFVEESFLKGNGDV